VIGVGSDFEKQMIAMTPLGRVGQPSDIAPIAVFLASDESGWLTGRSWWPPAASVNFFHSGFLLEGESVMCAPSVIQTALAGLSRRELLQVAAGLAAGTALAPPALKAADEPAVRSIGLSNVMDLTHTLSPKFPVIAIPGLTFPIKITAIATLEKFGVAVNKWELMDHNGTHIDAPCHFIAERQTVEQLPCAT